MISIDESLVDVSRLAIDTAPFIYLVESHPDFGAPVREIVQRAERGKLVLATSLLSLTEVLVQPYRQSRPELAAVYREILLYSPYLEILTLELSIADSAARIRAQHGIRTPDAIQIATALGAGCQAFLTNDTKLRRVKEPRVIVLSDLLAKEGRE